MTREQLELAFMNLNHERIFTPTNGAITHSKFGEISFDFKSNCAAVAAAGVLLQRTTHFNLTLCVIRKGLTLELSRPAKRVRLE